MKKITRLTLLLGAFLAWGSLFSIASAAQYCQTPITATDGVTSVKLSCQLISAGNYQIKIESDVAMSDLSAGCYCNINGVGGNQLISLPGYLKSGDGKTITVNIPSTSAPNLYTPLYILMPGEKNFAWPTGIEWGTCSSGGTTDTQAPTAFTATKGTVTSTGVELLLNATDNSGAVTYTISYGSTPTVVTTTGTSAVQKSYTISGLTPSTAYTFSVTAKDAAGNLAANNPITINATTTAGLTTSAPAPTCPAAKVISIFSDAYTGAAAVTNLVLNPGWGQATAQSIVQVGSDNVLKYANFNYQGTTFGHIFPIATGMKYLHLDVWTESETSLQVYPICWTGIANEPEKFKTITLTSADYGVWKSYDIPLTDFTSQGLTMVDVYQLKLVGSGGKTVYFDNIYFYDNSADVDTQAPTAFTATKGTVTSDAVELLLNATDNSGGIVYTISYGAGPTVLTTSGVSGTQKSYTVTGLNGSTNYSFSITAKDATGNVTTNSPIVVAATTLASIPAAPVPTVNASKVISVFSDTYTNLPTELQNWYGNTFSTVSLGENTTLKNATVCCFGYQFTNGPINVTGMTKLHVDVYPLATASMTLGTTGGGEFKKSNISLVANQWNSVNVLLSELTGANLASVAQIGFWDMNGTFYLDNLYFYNDATTELSSLENSNAINFYPNPATDKLIVNAKSEISQVIIRNLLGQTVKSINANSIEQSIDLTSVSAGNYFVTVKLANGQLSTQKFVKL